MVIFLLDVVLSEQMETVETLVIDSTASTEAGNGSGGRVSERRQGFEICRIHLRMAGQRKDAEKLHDGGADSPRPQGTSLSPASNNPSQRVYANHRCLDEGARFQISTTPMIGVAAGVFVWPRSCGQAGA